MDPQFQLNQRIRLRKPADADLEGVITDVHLPTTTRNPPTYAVRFSDGSAFNNVAEAELMAVAQAAGAKDEAPEGGATREPRPAAASHAKHVPPPGVDEPEPRPAVRPTLTGLEPGTDLGQGPQGKNDAETARELAGGPEEDKKDAKDAAEAADDDDEADQRAKADKEKDKDKDKGHGHGHHGHGHGGHKTHG